MVARDRSSGVSGPLAPLASASPGFLFFLQQTFRKFNVSSFPSVCPNDEHKRSSETSQGRRPMFNERRRLLRLYLSDSRY